MESFMKKNLASLVAIGVLALPVLSFADNGQVTVPPVKTTPTVSAPKPAELNANPKVNVNLADLAALEKVKGLGEKKAQALITYRTDHGNFKTIEDLVNVPGFGVKLVKKLQPYLTV
jgi:competence protein ComEA